MHSKMMNSSPNDIKIVETRYDSRGLHTKQWHLNNKLHRTDGPAVIYYYPSGNISSRGWWINGKKHKIDGPAYIEYIDSNKHFIYNEEWYVDGKRIHPEEWLEENNYSLPLNNDQQIELLLRFG